MRNPEEQPQPQDDYSQRLPAPEYTEQSDSAIIYQLDAGELHRQVEHSLRGEKYNEATGEWKVPKGGKPLMSDEGIEFFMKAIKMRVNNNTFLSFLTDKDIDRLCMDLHANLTDAVCLNWERWGVDKNIANELVYGTMDIVYIGLKRSINKTTLEYLKKTMHIIEQNKKDVNDKKKFGIF